MALIRAFIGYAVVPVLSFALAHFVVKGAFALWLAGDLNRPVPAFWVALLQTVVGGALVKVVNDAAGIYGGQTYVIIATLAMRSALINHPNDTGDQALNVPMHTAAIGTIVGVIIGYTAFS
jgi:hypothetical protein